MKRKLLIDADACPVIDIALSVSYRFQMESILFCDTSHRIEREGVVTITVPKGPDSVDFKLVNSIVKGDVVVTQDYGLAAMCIAKGAFTIDQNGREMNAANIDQLLAFRYESAKIRRSGGRTKGPKKRSKADNEQFEMNFTNLCKRITTTS